MIDQMKMMKQLAGLMGNPAELRAKFESVQAELARRTVEADAGAGAVRVTVNGRMEVVDVRLDPTMISALVGEGDDADRGMIEQLIVSATNAALEKAQTMEKEQMSSLTGGLNLPGLDGLLGN